MKKEDLQFWIDQLRKDKIIYGIEACAINLICLFGFFFSNLYFTNPLKDIINIILLIIAVGYSLYMGIGNAYRLKKVKGLERKIS
jgi:hypothetical protein